MNFNISDLSIFSLIPYGALGMLLLVGFYIVNHYALPLLKDRQHLIKNYWQKIQIIAWLLFFGLFFIALLRVNVMITMTFMLVLLGLGWNFWRNLFSGVVIKFNNQIQIGETISTDFATGELKAIRLVESILVNERGESVIVPNYKLRTAVLTHLYKSNIQTHSFTVAPANAQSIDTIYQMALHCPFISANQKIEVERIGEGEFKVKASMIDKAFVDQVKQYFL